MTIQHDLLPKLREVGAMLKTIKKATGLKPLPQDAKQSLGLRFQEVAAEKPNDVVVIFEGKRVTWGTLNAQANRVAKVLADAGVVRGDSVAIFMDNRVENLATILAVVKLGAVAAMINTNLTERGLAHCIQIVTSKAIVFGAELAAPLEVVKDELGIPADRFFAIADVGATTIPSWAKAIDPDDASIDSSNHAATSQVMLKDLAYFIFTSGTTGLPKATRISHDRHYRMAKAFADIALDMSPSDRLYVCLPLYHSSAMYVGFGSVVHAGASMFLRRKFSASKFLDEAREHQTNCFAYIGELCRYLMHQPRKADDARNPITKAVGNGLRPDIWMDFKTRYGIERICEFYGASEGNAGCVNAFNKDLTVGFCASKHAVVEYDVRDDVIVRERSGFCRKAKKGDPGLFVIEINDKAIFDGYADREATEKKILRDVFVKGDRYFNTGDLLRQVDVGFAFGIPHYQFVDRVGDTFRWKGENVSTNEIGEIINGCSAVEICNVYGVELPGTDGRAGMVGITPAGPTIDVAALSKHILEHVPSYARPLFIRHITEMDTTGTFKMKKGDLRDQAYHPDRCTDPVYVLKPGAKEYVALDEAFYRRIQAGDAGY